MTEKELRKLNRYQLLELILIQSEKIDELEKQLSSEVKKLHKANRQLRELIEEMYCLMNQ